MVVVVVLPSIQLLAHIVHRDELVDGLYKAELIHRRAPWKTKEDVELATLQWVAWFNNHHLLEPIGYIPPAEAEANYYRQLASQATSVAA